MSLHEATNLEINQLIRHREPMVMIDELTGFGDDWATGRKTFTGDSYGLCGGRVVEPLLIECLAQLAAAMDGALAQRDGKPPNRGMLVKATGFQIHRTPRADELLHLQVDVIRRKAAFSCTRGEIEVNGTLAAGGILHFHH